MNVALYIGIHLHFTTTKITGGRKNDPSETVYVVYFSSSGVRLFVGCYLK